MAEKRVDPDDGKAYTYDELAAYYKGKFKVKQINAYWENECTPTKKGKAKAKAKGKGKAKAKPEPKGKAKGKAKAKAKGKAEAKGKGKTGKAAEKEENAKVIKKTIKAFHTASFAPNPMLLDIFIREKGLLSLIDNEVQVDLMASQNRNEEYIKKNPAGQLPFFELKDGSVIAETIAMAEYLEELVPKPSIIGSTPKERAKTRMMQRRMEEHFVYPAFYAFRFWTASSDCTGPFKDFFKHRNSVLIPEGYKKQHEWALSTLKWLEALKKEKSTKFICGNKMTVVDIQTFTTLEFFKDKNGPYLETNKDDLPWLCEWFERMSGRPSVKACLAHIAGYPVKAKAEFSGGEDSPSGVVTFVQTNEETCRITYTIKGLKEGKFSFKVDGKDVEGSVEPGKKGVARGKIIDKTIKLKGDSAMIGKSVTVSAEGGDAVATGEIKLVEKEKKEEKK